MPSDGLPHDEKKQELQKRLEASSDASRVESTHKRHRKGYRTARENVDDLCDQDSFLEIGQLVVAAQRNTMSREELLSKTSTDGIITGLATINAHEFGTPSSQVAVVVNDYSVLAATQGYFHHKKLDRMIELAAKQSLPTVMYTEGGGGRPFDSDVNVAAAGLNVTTFANWAALNNGQPRIAVNNGYCFAGSAALFGSADIRIATQSSWIGMAGPSMIEFGGLGKCKAEDIGPITAQQENGVVDIVADDEAHATALAKQALGYFQGVLSQWRCADQAQLGSLMPEDRRFTYNVRRVLETIADSDTLLEIKPHYATTMITAFIRIEGVPYGVMCNDNKTLGGAIDAAGADKAADFLALCDRLGLAVVSFCDTPGFMVGPASEEQGAVRRMSRLFSVGATLTVPLVCIVLRRAYGLGAMAMAGGSMAKPVFCASWSSGEFGAMGLEGAVELGYKKQLDAIKDKTERKRQFDAWVAKEYERGRATEVASYFEIDAVIHPEQTRDVISRAMRSSGFHR